MKTLAILSQKGGAGKTTLALHLAVAGVQAKRQAAVIYLDPQASAMGWKDSRSQETPVVVSAPPGRLSQVLATAEQNGADLAILDTAPHSESTALAAARAADLILIPCRPAILDLRAISFTVDVAKLASTPAVVVLNAVPSRGHLSEEASSAIASYGMEVAPVSIGHRAAYVHALTAGQAAQEYETQGKAAKEIKSLYRWICKHVDL
jgi:chromosome partitioning protein